MTDRNPYSPEPSPQSRVDTQADNPSRSQVSLLTIFTSSDELGCPDPFTSSTDNTSGPGENAQRQDGYIAPSIVTVETPGEGPYAAMDVSTNGRSDPENPDESNQSNPTKPFCAALPTTGNHESKVTAPKKAHEKHRSSLTRLNRMSTPILLFILALCLLVTVNIYVQSTYAAEESSRQGRPLSGLLKTDVSRTLTILRTSQGILSALVSLALENVFVLLQWGQIHPPGGISYLKILALSPTTSALGTFGLIRSSAPKLSTKLLALSSSVCLDIHIRAGISNLID